MNVIITLPPELIAEILEQRKTFEIRSKIPSHFNIDKDVVFVVQKGTHKVPMFFTVREFFTYSKYAAVDEFLARKASVPVGWIKAYRQNKIYVSAWVIACVCKVENTVNVWDYLGINRAPQCFVYNHKEWRCISCSHYLWNPSIYFEEKLKLMHPKAKHRLWLKR